MILVSKLASLSKYTPPGVVLGFFSAFLADKKYMGAWKHEFIGTLLMIGLTFSPGKWIGVDSQNIAWLCHAIGVISADFIGGGPHVNPAVSVTMYALGKCDYTEMYVRICGSMVGGLLAFPLFLTLSQTLGWNDLGGPEYHLHEDEDDGTAGFLNEFFATFLLLVAIFVLNWELNFGKYHYWIKQPLTAVVIRFLIEVFPASGPAINPMLGTAWAVFAAAGSGKFGFPESTEHYYVYWFGPILGGLLAGFGYTIYAGGEFFGFKVPIGPIKEEAPAPSAPPKKSKGSKKGD